MYVRLAFAVAAHLEPEILIIDEVLAVGDAQFQRKCLGKMGEVSSGGRTVLFVSHNMSAVRRLCNRVVLLEGGRVSAVGDANEVIVTYLGLADTPAQWVRSTPPPEDVPVCISEVSLVSDAGRPVERVASTAPFAFELAVEALRDTPPMQIAIRITNQEGIAVLTTSNIDQYLSLVPLTRGRHEFRVTLPGNLLTAGSYYAGVTVHIPGLVLFETVDVAFSVEDTGSVASVLRDGRLGIVGPLLKWEETSGQRRSESTTRASAAARGFMDFAGSR
jgi:lipopolysaccharide transport system ATP-binding protein